MAARKKAPDDGMSKPASKPASRAAATASAAPAPKPQAMLRIPIGQGPAFARLITAARTLRMHHAVVVSGAPGTGKSTIARWIAAALVCPSELDTEGPCGVCRHCRRVASGAHPDLHFLQPPEQKQVIPVESVRALQDTLQLAAVEARARVVIIDPADALGEEGQNTLLKTLEEPGVATFLLLCTARPELLLATVRSRCERLNVRGLSRDRIAQEISARNAGTSAQVDQALATANGSLGRALAACTEQTVQIHDLVLATLDSAKQLRPLATARNVLEGCEGRAEAVQRARVFLRTCATEASLRLERSLASGGDASYPAVASEPWVSVLELALLGLQDLELQIPADQVIVGAVLGIARLLRRAGSLPSRV